MISSGADMAQVVNKFFSSSERIAFTFEKNLVSPGTGTDT